MTAPFGGILLHSARMDQDQLRGLLTQVQAGAVDVDAALERAEKVFADFGGVGDEFAKDMRKIRM